MKKRLSVLMIIALLISYMVPITPFETVTYGAGEKMTWIRNDTLDTGLEVIRNKAGESDILLNGKLGDLGTYVLQYYLEDGRQTTITFQNKFNELDISYKVEELRTTAPDTIEPVNITQELVDQSYLKMNYDLQVPTWEYIEGQLVDAVSGGLEYNIKESAGIQYPGIAIDVSNNRLIIRWDFQTDQLFILVDGYEKGNIMPVSYTNPSLETTELNILKGFEAFNVTPTHIRVDEAGTANEDVGLVSSPGDDKPGSRPGIEITFKQPKTFDPLDWQYKYNLSNLSGLTAVMDFQNIANGDYLDFTLGLNDAIGSVSKSINDLPSAETVNNNVVYDYDTDDFLYTIQIVKDKSTLINPSEFIQWANINSSSIYNVGMAIQVEDDNPQFSTYRFAGFKPVSNFAYTYMEYELRRANMTEAYLDITPYNIGAEDKLEYKVLYSKVKKEPLEQENDLWVQHFHDGQVGDGTNIFIPVPFNAESSQDVYQIVVNFAAVDLPSQVLNYKAELDLNVPPTTPRIEYITNLFVIPSDTENDDLSHVQFDIAWKAPDDRDTGELSTIFANNDGDETNDHIYYEIMVNEVPEDTIGNPFRTIKVIDVYLEGGEIKMKVHDLAPGSGEPSDAANYTLGYNAVDQTFRMDGITIYDNNAWTEVIETYADENTNTYDIPNILDPYDFEYPGVNYIRLKAITEIDGKIGISYNSIPVSLSLSLLEYEIPIVESMSYTAINGQEQGDPVGIDFKWRSVATDTYETHMLSPIGKQINNVIYDVYISENEEAILNLNPEDDIYDSLVVDPDNHIFLDSADPIDAEDLDDLRNDQVKMFSVTTAKNINSILNTRITGLDQNTIYFIRVVTRLAIEDESSVISEKSSELSNMLSVTTPIIPSDPDDGEVKPLSVENLIADYADENFISAILSWDYPDEIVFAEDKYGFEILSLEDVTLPDALTGRDLTVEEVYNNPLLANNNKEMWRLTIEEGVIHLVKYNEDTDAYELLDASNVVVGDQSIELLDPTNTPNKVYYYYVRTINTFEGSVNAASSWRYDSLTTSPVKAPINLMAVYDSGYPMNEKTQSIIRFDAPIPPTADLNTEYIIEIFVKGKDDLDYTLTKYPFQYLGQSGDGAVGYTRMYYRIDGLDTGSSYSIKVRIEDRTKEQDELPDGSMSYSKSPFSPRIVIRTEFDQGEYEKEFAYNDYLEAFKDKAKKLLQKDYFIIHGDSNDTIIKYRDSYSIGSLIQKHDDYYELIVPTLKDKQKTYTYYLPAAFFETANANSVMISIRPGSHQVGIRPYSIGKTVTSAIKEALAEIKSYDSSMIDYYVALSVSVGPYNSKINGKSPVSDVLSVSASVYGATEKEIYIDEDMVKAMEELIDEHTEDLKIKLIEELEKGIDESKLLGIVEAEVALVQVDYYGDASLIFNSRIMNNYKAIVDANKNLYIQLASYGEPTDQEAYSRKTGLWQSTSSSYYNNAYLIENKGFSSYILAGRDTGSSALSGVYASEELSVINKYKLTDIFTVNELLNESQPILKYQLISAFARMLNATVGNDNSTYLKNQGINFVNTKTFAAITNEETLYMYTQVFAKRHNIKLNSVYIHDYNMIEDMNQVNMTYRDVLLKGANLGLFELEYGQVLPTTTTDVSQLINLLTLIEKGLY